PRPHPSSLGLWPLQPSSPMQASHSSKVTAYLPAANDAGIDTRTCVSSLSRCGSFAGEPMEKLPAGATIISGQVGQSLKLSLGLRQRFSPPTCASMPSHRVGVGPGGGGCAGGVAIATCSGGALGGVDGVPPVNLSHQE